MTRVAIVGAGGVVGREILDLLLEDGIENPVAFGSPASRGKAIAYGSTQIRGQVLWETSLAEFDLAYFAAGSDVAREWAPKFVEAGAVVIDNSSAYRLDESVPLVVPEVNVEAIRPGPGIIANPNCSTIILLLALAPLMELEPQRVVVSTYQAVSGAGRNGLEALDRELRSITANPAADGPSGFESGNPFPFPIASNLFPLIGEIDGDGWATEERKMLDESRKILDRPDLDLLATCVRVPVHRCHSESVTLSFDHPVDLARARGLLGSAPGVVLHEDPLDPPLPISLQRQPEVGVGRLRQVHDRVLQFWVVGDQLLKGAALNAVQIGRHVISR